MQHRAEIAEAMLCEAEAKNKDLQNEVTAAEKEANTLKVNIITSYTLLCQNLGN